jgi:protein-glutamine gamma-glutamyltransferase
MKKAIELTALRPLLWATAACGAGTLLSVDRVPAWVPVAALVLAGWRIWVAARPTRSQRLPGAAVRNFLAILLIAAVLVTFRALNGLSAGTALLILMGGCKLLETRSRRDLFVVVGAALFLLLAACLDRQDLLRAPLYLGQVWLCCAALAVIAYAPTATEGPVFDQGFDNRSAVLLAGRTLLLAAPLAIVLFVFFPRLAGAFWSLPRGDTASTGLSDTMSPGSITDLTASYEIAFRARFEGAAPPPAMRYWRGPVLHNFDGYTWRRLYATPYVRPTLEYLGKPYRYQVILEPSSQRWWFALDTLQHPPPGDTVLTDDNELISRQPITDTTVYKGVSYTSVKFTSPLPEISRRRDTATPPRNPHSREFARELRARSGSDGAYVAAVLEFLRTGGFKYTLTPPPLGADSVDEFLFNTRLGFCGHFASAFVVLMRAAGVPAHVVTGYLGGDWNPVGGYFVVRQSDAHAWAEVWLEGRGWTRVDPTAVVEPGRLDRGILDLLPEAGSAQARLVRRSTWLTALVQRWDAANAWWTEHVVKFDFRSQIGILESLGIDSPDARDLGWAFAAGLLLWMAWIAWEYGRSPGGPPQDRVALAYARLCRKLAKAGLGRAPHQGPLAYADTVSLRRPDLASSLRPLLEQYAHLRFGSGSHDPDELQILTFERRIRNLKVSGTA